MAFRSSHAGASSAYTLAMMATLRDLLALDELRFMRGGEEEMLAMTNIVRG